MYPACEDSDELLALRVPPGLKDFFSHIRIISFWSPFLSIVNCGSQMAGRTEGDSWGHANGKPTPS